MDKNKVQVFALSAVLLLGAIAGYLLADSHGPKSATLPEMSSSETATNMHRMPDGTMMSHGDMMMGHMDMMVTSEQAFIEGMIPHHQEAIDTAKEVLERGGTTATMRALAENIILAQESEIEQMKEWYEEWYGVAYHDVGGYVPMMRDLSELQGAELDRIFLEDMVMHHMGAIMMARSVEPYLEHKEMVTLVQAVIETQSAEIQQMQSMVQEL